jgi:adenylylsulfate kinase-like enzyme
MGRKRQGEVVRNMAKFLTDQNIDVIMCNIGMVEEERRLNRALLDKYFEIYLEVSMEELIRRDAKGLYKAALEGKEKNVYGVDILTEYPENPDLKIVNEGENTPKDALNAIIEKFHL